MGTRGQTHTLMTHLEGKAHTARRKGALALCSDLASPSSSFPSISTLVSTQNNLEKEERGTGWTEENDTEMSPAEGQGKDDVCTPVEGPLIFQGSVDIET